MPAPRYTLNGQPGRFFPAHGMDCFVPESCVLPDGALDTFAFTKGGWASLNCGAHESFGSHLFPETMQPIRPSTAALEKFARRGFPATLVAS